MSGIHLFTEPIVIAANGPFPTHPIPLKAMDESGTLICTDGSADKILDSGNEPHVIIGDEDSTHLNPSDCKGLWISAPDQNKTDLHKTLDWCSMNNIKTVTIVGATGDRDDQTQANISLIGRFVPEMNITIITDVSTISCHNGNAGFISFKGQTVSLIGSGTITTQGLKFELDNQKLEHITHGVSNRAEGTQFEVESDEPVWVFRAHPE